MPTAEAVAAPILLFETSVPTGSVGSDITFFPGHIAATSQVFAPTVQPEQFVLPSFVHSPEVVDGLVGWYDANEVSGSDGDAISTWPNLVAGGKPDFTQSGGARPQIKRGVLGGQDAMRFDGTDDYFTSGVAADWTFLQDGTGATVFVVWTVSDGPEPGALEILLATGNFASSSIGFTMAYDDASSGFQHKVRGYVGDGDGVSNVTDLRSENQGAWAGLNHVTGFKYETGYSELWTNGSIGGWDEDTPGAGTSSDPVSALRVGRSASGSAFFFQGDIAEILIFDEVVGEEDLLRINAYLEQKYRINSPVMDDYDLVLNDGESNAFASFAICDNGDYLGVYRAGGNHGSTDGEIHTIRSTDNGVTWGSPVTVVDDAWDNRDPGMTRLSDGTLALTLGRRTAAEVEGTTGATFYKSTDDGATWSSEEVLPTTFTDWCRGGSPPLEMDNGDILTLVYGEDSGDTRSSVELLRSTDGGDNWTVVTRVNDGPTDGRDYNESTLYKLSDGSLRCLSRQGQGGLYYASSTDDGATWSAQVKALDGYWSWPKGAVDEDDRLYMLMRDVDGNARWVHTEDWVDFTQGQLIFEGGEEYGYGQSVIADDGKILTFFSYEDTFSDGRLYFLEESTFTPTGGSLVFEPELTFDSLIFPTLIASTSQVFEPVEVDGGIGETQEIFPGLIASTSQVFAPNVVHEVEPTNIASTAQVFAPTVFSDQAIESGFIASAAQVFTPSVIPAQAIDANFISSTAQVFAPSVKHEIDLTNIASTAQVFAPTVTTTVSFAPSVIASTATVFAPNVVVEIDPTFIASTTQVFAPKLNLTLYSGFTASTSTVFAPSLVQEVEPGFISATSAVYAPSLGLLLLYTNMLQEIGVSTVLQEIGVSTIVQTIGVVEPGQVSDVDEAITTLEGIEE